MRLLVVLLLVLLVLLQWRLWFGAGGMRTVWELEQAVEAQQAENLERERRNRSLAAEVEDLKKGLEAIEERARSEMGMIREGEIFYQIIERPARRDADERPAPE